MYFRSITLLCRRRCDGFVVPFTFGTDWLADPTKRWASREYDPGSHGSVRGTNWYCATSHCNLEPRWWVVTLWRRFVCEVSSFLRYHLLLLVVDAFSRYSSSGGRVSSFWKQLNKTMRDDTVFSLWPGRNLHHHPSTWRNSYNSSVEIIFWSSRATAV